MDLQIGGWVGFRKLDVRILVREIIRTLGNPIIIVRCMDFLGRACSDLEMGGWFSRNPYKLLDDPLATLFL